MFPNCATILEGDPEHVLVCGKDRYYRGEEFMFDGPRINLAQESPQERVVHYFQNVSINGMFYGLMRRNLLSSIDFSSVLGGDWLIISAMAYLGKTRTLETVSINRSVAGASENVETLALRMGMTPRFDNPHLAVAKTVFAELGWRSPIYQSLGKTSRLLMAARSSWGVFARYCLPLYRSRAKAFGTRLRRWPSRLLDRHVSWRFRKRS